MFDQWISFYHSLPGAIQWGCDFFFSVIILRGIIANEILKELKERGIVRKGNFHKIVDWLIHHTLRSNRLQAIWDHYQLQADGSGHAGDILACGQGKCVVFH